MWIEFYNKTKQFWAWLHPVRFIKYLYKYVIILSYYVSINRINSIESKYNRQKMECVFVGHKLSEDGKINHFTRWTTTAFIRCWGFVVVVVVVMEEWRWCDGRRCAPPNVLPSSPWHRWRCGRWPWQRSAIRLILFDQLLGVLSRIGWRIQFFVAQLQRWRRWFVCYAAGRQYGRHRFNEWTSSFAVFGHICWHFVNSCTKKRNWLKKTAKLTMVFILRRPAGFQEK